MSYCCKSFAYFFWAVIIIEQNWEHSLFAELFTGMSQTKSIGNNPTPTVLSSILTNHVRSTRENNLFSRVCLSVCLWEGAPYSIMHRDRPESRSASFMLEGSGRKEGPRLTTREGPDRKNWPRRIGQKKGLPLPPSQGQVENPPALTPPSQ